MEKYTEKGDGNRFLVENYAMKRLRRLIPNTVFVAIIALAIVGCAGTPPHTPLEPGATNSAQDNAVFATGYGAISRKYIDPVRIADIAINGLDGFAAIDPALRIERVAGRIVMKLDGAAIAEAPAPEADNAQDWAKLTTAFSLQARRHSLLMHKASAEKVYEAVFDGVLSDLDIFSRYAGAEEAKMNRARRDGFGGIGIRFRIKKGKAVVTEVMPETPAAETGLKIADQITHVDGEPLSKPKVRQVVKRLRGPTQSTVKVRVYRPSADHSLDMTLERRHIISPTVRASRHGDILKLRISGFNQATARTMAAALERANDEAKTLGRLKGIVLDLRGNPGGLLKQSVKLADLVLTHGLIISTRGRHPDSPHYYEAGGRDITDGLPIAVLVDGKSASASEIVAAALQDRDRAVLIGTSSFGKGSVQTVIRLPNDGEITLTWSRFVAPSGYILHGLGVRPGICTSGSPADIDTLVQSALARHLAARKTYASWRIPGARESADRKLLRDTCPPQRHKTDLEFKIAKHVLGDRQLYTQALDLSSATHQARH